MTNREPKVHVIDGVTFVEVDRKAKVGDKVFVINNGGRYYKKGDYAKVTKVFDVDDYGISADLTENKDFYDDGKWDIDYRDYVVLEKPKPTLDELLAKCTPENRHEEVFAESPQVIEMLTSLSRKIVSLESQLRDTQGNLEKQSYELANTRHRLAKHADRFAAIEDMVEMLTDDIVTVDERSQVLNAINKYYAEGSR